MYRRSCSLQLAALDLLCAAELLCMHPRSQRSTFHCLLQYEGTLDRLFESTGTVTSPAS